MFILNKSDLDSIFSAVKKSKFLVIGDYCLDAYYFLDNSLSEVSIETGLNTYAVKNIKLSAGGAGNVCANLIALGAKNITGVGVVGEDLYGEAYIKFLNEKGLKTKYFVKQKEDWLTCVYTKLYDGYEEKPRVDFGNANILHDKTADMLIENINKLLPQADIVLVNQQLLHGIHTEYFQKKLKDVVRKNKDKIFILDSRDLTDVYSGMWRKLNDIEASKTLKQNIEKIDYKSAAQVEKNAVSLYNMWKTPVIITRGDRGIIAFDGKKMHSVGGTNITNKIDTVGAGDSVFAGLASGIVSGIGLDKAINFANCVSSVTIQKLFETGVATEKEVRDFAQNIDYTYNHEKAESMRFGPYVKGTDIEIIQDFKPRKIEYAVFDNDGTISTLRQGWEDIMAPVMMKCILGSHYKSVSEKKFKEIAEEVKNFIDKTTGIQTIRQMEGLVEIVKSHGYVPKDKTLSAKEYKKIYLDELIVLVNDRLSRLKRGERNIEDYTMKGSVEMLQKLRERGVTIFLASGTDEKDVKREAKELGYAHYFNGGIFGAGDDVVVEPKKIVLEMILKKIGTDKAKHIMTFGDGPVELRETTKRGGLSIGIASNEVQRFGLNEKKRKRLVLAGADLIIADFSQHDKLLKAIMK